MSRSINKVTLIGTLGRDPEVRSMPVGGLVANLSLATDESYNDKQTGQKVEQTEWHRLTVYGKLAEIAQQYLKKGSKAYFEGKLKTREWEKDGVKRYTTEIVVSEMLMLDSKPQAAQQQQQYAQPAQHPQAYQAQPHPMYAQQQPAQPQQKYQPLPQNHYHTQNQLSPAQQAAQNGQAGQPYWQQQPAQPTNQFDNTFSEEIPF